jgi:Icc-related predicted phosphoesterase
MTKARFIHISDIHNGFGDLKTVREYAKKEKIDAVLFSGDVLGSCISGPQAQEMNAHLDTIAKAIPKDSKFKNLDELLDHCQKEQSKDTEQLKLNSMKKQKRTMPHSKKKSHNFVSQF